MKITGLAHVCLQTGNLDRAERFYDRILGFPRVFNFYREDQRVGAYFKLNDFQFLEIFESADAEPVNRSLNHFCLETADLKSVVHELESHGCDVTQPQLGADETWQAWVQDPDGNRIEIQEYTAGSHQFTQKDCRL